MVFWSALFAALDVPTDTVAQAKDQIGDMYSAKVRAVQPPLAPKMVECNTSAPLAANSDGSGTPVS